MKSVITLSDTQYSEQDWGTLRWVANGALENTDELTVGHVIIKQGCSNPRHAHSNCEEILYLLKGSLEHTLDDEKITLNTGDTITVPSGIFHNGINTGECNAEMIVVYSSANRKFETE